jgi:carbon-monoxide dehydrogenase small subunit
MQVALTINGEERSADVEPRTLLVHFIRDDLDLTGTHWGCDTSNCGACVVLMDGEPVKSCTVLAASAAGHEITTVEGLERDGVLDPVQEGFMEEHGLQCGFCTPGMMLTARALLDRVEPAVHLERLDGADLVALAHGGQCRARLDRLAVHEDDARAAVGRVAAPVRAGHAELLAQEVDQQRARLGLG